MRIKLVQSGWETYTGNFGGVAFEKGESVGEVSTVQARTLGNIIQVRNIESDVNPSSSQQAVDSRTYVAVEEVMAERKMPEPEPVKAIYTREELEAIASEKGIKGLRDIAAKVGVKAVSINTMIDGLMAHYGRQAETERQLQGVVRTKPEPVKE